VLKSFCVEMVANKNKKFTKKAHKHGGTASKKRINSRDKGDRQRLREEEASD
jgi:hypothetical protein